MSRSLHKKHVPPSPAGSYSIAFEAAGLVFLAGQTPRGSNNVRHGDKPFSEQVRLALANLDAAAATVGLSLEDAVKIGVYLKDPSRSGEFDAIYREYVKLPFPARTLVQSSLIGFDVEVDAILSMRKEEREGDL
jgi:enamine deaminase RidA (YjgF/YER057c/UK114 family)